jgi:hypothetical protein
MSQSLTHDDLIPRAIVIIRELEVFAGLLKQRNNLIVHQEIDEFFYLQKAAELKLLVIEYERAQLRLNEVSGWLDDKVREAIKRKDIDMNRFAEIEQSLTS